MACKEGSSRKEHLRSLGKHRFGFAPCFGQAGQLLRGGQVSWLQQEVLGPPLAWSLLASLSSAALRFASTTASMSFCTRACTTSYDECAQE